MQIIHNMLIVLGIIGFFDVTVGQHERFHLHQDRGLGIRQNGRLGLQEAGQLGLRHGRLGLDVQKRLVNRRKKDTVLPNFEENLHMPSSNKSTYAKKGLYPHMKKGLHRHHKKNGLSLPDYSKNPQHTSVALLDSTSSGCPTSDPPQGGCTDDCSNLEGTISIMLAIFGVAVEAVDVFGGSVIILLDAIVGAFYPSETTDNSKLISDLVNYVDEKIDEEISNEIVNDIKGEWGLVYDYSQKLLDGIKNNLSPDYRKQYLDDILDTRCDTMLEKLGDPSLFATDAASLIGPIGTQCLTWYHARAYNYTEITNETINDSTVKAYKDNLDQRISEFSSLSNIAYNRSIDWRISKFDSQNGKITKEAGYTIPNVCYTGSYEIVHIEDHACPGIGGPPADSDEEDGVGFGSTQDGCLELILHTDDPPSYYRDLYIDTGRLDAAIKFYKLMVQHSYVDQFVSPFTDNYSLLWKYLNSSNFEAGIKPTLKTRIAVSPPRHEHTMNLISGYDDKIHAVYTTQDNILERFGLMGNDFLFIKNRITKISVKRIPYGINTVAYTTEYDSDFVGQKWNSIAWDTIEIPENNVITAISGIKYGSSSFGIKTTKVDDNGAHVKNGTMHDGIKWVIGSEKYIDWIEAPLGTHSNQTFVSYVPNIIGIVGWYHRPYSAEDNYRVGDYTPIWAYKRYE